MAQPGKPNPPKTTAVAKPSAPAPAKAQPAVAAAAPQSAPAAKAAAKAGGATGAERARMISEAAYFIAQKRGTVGNPLADWLTAEQQIDLQLGQRR
jgi:hypothetical protein